MATYYLTMSEECGGEETVEITAESLDDARRQAAERTEAWVQGGDYGSDGASVRAGWTLEIEGDDGDLEEVADDDLTVEIEPDHRALIRAAGGNPDCDHDWTSEGEGGCESNPGVYSVGGTAMVFHSHCTLCGLRRRQRVTGAQRNPGEHDTVSYEQPDSVECED